MRFSFFFVLSSFFAAGVFGSSTAVVVSGSQESSQIGIQILETGGSAADAVVAVSLALGVSEPFGSGPGGKLAMLYFDKASGETVFINGMGQSPLDFPVEEYQDASYQERSRSFLAVCTPGLIPGLWELHQRFGRKPWAEDVLPSARLAERGFELDEHSAAIFRRNISRLRENPQVRQLYTVDGRPPVLGSFLPNPVLAATMERLAINGIDEFRTGATARMLVRGIQEGGGWISLEDLAEYQAYVEEPLSISWNGYDVLTSPSPTAGGATILMALKGLEGNTRELNQGAVERLDLMGRTLRATFPRVYRSFGDDESFADQRVDAFSSKNLRNLKKEASVPLLKSVSMNHFSPEQEEEGGLRCTTHFVIVDQEGNVASVTQSLSSRFGAGLIAPGTGFLLNNSMKNFAIHYSKSPNYIGEGKRPRSTIAPTIIFEDDQPRLALGAPGGQRIPTAIVQVISAVLQQDESLEDAVNAPRYHLRRPRKRSEPDQYVEVEPEMGEDWRDEMTALGWDVHFVSRDEYYFGGVNGIFFDSETQMSTGVADPRRSNYVSVGSR
ncbi:gamma-glutamyltransferase family protein [Puniceicoccus vermicola]|uniref:Gamma-glutamyltransferase family protein n=1 Tax=Puniceicoccus vermicola TaxID=388746 RepID=A0A7X1AWD7_9BACT|nr:gamma-glutamyltransferase family protein [Puniceicoccus vermicola]MBC2600298.1 gamma-glutamyltransferase family protein [Puniceicoccus vermicola]